MNRSIGNGNSFSNGNSMGADHLADWYAGVPDDRLLYHWWAM